MSDKRSSIPPGYKRAEVGVIPKDWRVAHLGDITEKVGSGITPTGGSRVYRSMGRPFLRSQNVGWGKLDLEDIVYIDQTTHESFISTEIKKGDVFLNITGASIGRSAVANAQVIGGNVNQHVCIIRLKKKEIDSFFLNAFLLSPIGQDQIDSFQAGGNRQGLNFEQIRSFLVPLPPLPEQLAIARALADADAWIEALDRLIAKKRAIKRAAMGDLLTGRVRLPGFSGVGMKHTEIGEIPEDWDITTIGQLGKFGKGRGIKRNDVSEIGFPCIRYGEIYTLYDYFVTETVSKISESVAKQSQEIQKGDLLFTGSGETAEEIGKCVAYLGDEPAYAGGDVIILTPTADDALFLGYLFNSPIVVDQKAQFGQGDAVVHISIRNLENIKIPLPSLREQQAIAQVLSDMDAEIEALERERDKARAIKQGMMQELLTGRIRLTS